MKVAVFIPSGTIALHKTKPSSSLQLKELNYYFSFLVADALLFVLIENNISKQFLDFYQDTDQNN